MPIAIIFARSRFKFNQDAFRLLDQIDLHDAN